MRTLSRRLIVLSICAAPLFAGALLIQIGDPAANPEAFAKHAVVVARIIACHSPEKTTLTATAEGSVNGERRSIPLKVSALSTAGTFAIAREWPHDGDWAVKLVATNPDYKNYATSLLVPFEGNRFRSAAIKQYLHAPTDAEVAETLDAIHHDANKSLN